MSSRRKNVTYLLAGMTGLFAAACGGGGASSGENCGYLPCDAGTGVAPPPPGRTDGGYVIDGGPAVIDFDPKSVQRSAGCGKPLPADQMPTVPESAIGYTQYSVMLTGTTLAGTDPTRATRRTFWVRVPADYDPNRPYRLVYITQGCGGYNVSKTQTFQLYRESQGGTEQAVYVTLDIPTDMQNQDCYDTRSGLGSEEWEVFPAVQSVVDSTFCVDDNAIFVDSYGDDGVSIANMWGCYFAANPPNQRILAPARHIRGQSSVSGGDPPDLPACGGPVAALWIHDPIDSSAYERDIHALDRVLAGNGCQGDHTNSPTSPWPIMPDVCLQYTSCPADYPVVFCTTMGEGHADQHERAIPAFTAFDDIVSPTTSSPHDAGAGDAADQ